MRVRNALLLDNVARGNPYARLPTHSSNIMAATVKASRYGNKAKIGKSAAKLVVYDENVHRAQWSIGLWVNMVCSTPGMSEQSLKLSTNSLFVVRSRSVRAAVGDRRKSNITYRYTLLSSSNYDVIFINPRGNDNMNDIHYRWKRNKSWQSLDFWGAVQGYKKTI